MEEMDSIFVIVIESQPSDGEYPVTTIEGHYYLTQQEAHYALTWTAAENYGMELHEEDNYFDVPTPSAGMDYELYYIEELIRG